MADTTNVTPIRPPPPKAPAPRRKRTPVEKFSAVEKMLDEHQARICAARAVAKLASESMLHCTSETLIDQREKHRAALEAIDLLLAPVQGIGTFEDLIQAEKVRQERARFDM